MAGELHVTTDNEAIRADRLGAEAVETRTDSARIRLNLDEAIIRVSVRTDNGAIAVRVPDLEVDDSVDADSDDGGVDIDVRTDPDADRHVTARSGNGAIDVEYRTG